MTYQTQRRKGIMLCYPFEERRLAKWKPPYLVQPKLDGVRCRAVWIENHYLLLSSEENIIYSVPHINEALDNLGTTYELDGELYKHGLTFEEIFSITSRSTNLHPDHKEIKFHIFDIPSDKPQHNRIFSLMDLAYEFRPPLEVVDSWLADNLEVIMSRYDQILEMGYEGIIVRHIENLYIRRRSIYMMKFKPKKHDIYQIIDWKEEVSIEGTPKSRLGALLCESDNSVFSVGSGLTDQQRVDLWSMRESLPGKFVKVGYQHITSSGKVPRFPVFMKIVEKGGEEDAAGS
ncbi:hypothetical protein KAR91_34645 [Candidatus Pacearchaeota archaeon]|nr:hypothetical protein [Candidatus Pacearchaeota archaeon]